MEGEQQRLEKAEEELERAMKAVLDNEEGDGAPAKGEL